VHRCDRDVKGDIGTNLDRRRGYEVFEMFAQEPTMKGRRLLRQVMTAKIRAAVVTDLRARQVL
jgi:hypothetical protein